jgi:antitoxin component YwqK of YwqJK toxin-antitoxin module
MKKTLIFLMLAFIGCSKTPVDMDEKLFDRAGRYITRSDFSSIWFYNLKVYNGPAFSMHRSGERKEKGDIVNGAKSGSWSGWDEKGNLKYKGDYINNTEDGKWAGYFTNGKIKYEGVYKNGKQIGTWKYYNKKGKMTTEEKYFSCDEKCEETHSPRPCGLEGKIKKSKNFK